MEKISGAKATHLLKTASATILSQESELKDLREKIASYEKRERAEKIAHDMQDKGLNADLDFNEKVASLLSESTPHLDTVEEAVKMAAPQRDLFGVSDHPGGTGQHPFIHFIETGESLD